MKAVIKLVLLSAIVQLLVSCSYRTEQPAPVTSLTTYNTGYEKGSIKGSRYKVKRGDTLYSIAFGANRDYKQLAYWNKLPAPYTIFPGQILKLNKPSIPKKNYKNKAKTTKKSVVNSKNPPRNKTEKNSSQKILDKNNQAAYSVKVEQQKSNKPSTQNSVASQKINSQKKVERWVWPYRGKIIARFSSKAQGNKGVKFSGSRGDPIKAAADGKVVYAGNALRGYGNLVIINHNNNYLSAYAHADKILVKEKQQVKAGQTVATMGSTGTNRVMLHFEIRYHGKSVNPLQYLPK
ncbi:peptidoglycan DD-metalloendopeptidase family protein [Parashewanella tropica]|uniref:peptidoglycan DD-metalloendopeptidase family protein n=1 Tax=Parashewanella tropica TaxID=2547970 RepID=UPI001FE2B145|nr:peptidoglycan DD-metalloendopeptidase family protein [Parashewanella tropica]